MDILSIFSQFVQIEAARFGCFESDIYAMVLVSMVGACSLCWGMWRTCVR